MRKDGTTVLHKGQGCYRDAVAVAAAVAASLREVVVVDIAQRQQQQQQRSTVATTLARRHRDKHSHCSAVAPEKMRNDVCPLASCARALMMCAQCESGADYS